MNINWMSNAPWASTGYGNQSKLFVPRIKALGHDIVFTAFYGLEGAILNWDGIPVYPKGHDIWGNDIAAAHTAHSGAKVLITLMDAWVCDPVMMQLHGIHWVPWFPVDMEPLPMAVARKVRSAFRRIVFTRFAEKAVTDADMDCYYVPHGVNTKTFKPGIEAEAREKFGWADKFVVGMVAANKGIPSRKALPEHVEAFARLHKRHPDTLLYVHTHPSEHGEFQGVNMAELVEFHGLKLREDVYIPDPYQLLLGHNEEYMRAIYNAMDVFLLVSMGEGFGIPIVEAQACGTPVIVGDWTAMSELCFGGWKISKCEADRWYTPLGGTYQYKPRVDAIDDALEQAYRSARATDKIKAARKGARAYDADRITRKYWKPVLQQIEAAVNEAVV